LQVIPSAWGKKVRVIGENGHFDFRTLGEVRLQGEVKGRLGFEKAKRILEPDPGKSQVKAGEGRMRTANIIAASDPNSAVSPARLPLAGARFCLRAIG